MGKQRWTLVVFFGGIVVAGLKIAAGDPSTIASAIAAVMICGGALGAFLVYYTRPRFGALHALMTDGRTLRDYISTINPGNSRVNERPCRDWERLIYRAVKLLDAGLAESFMLGTPELEMLAHHSNVNWLHFMDVRLDQLNEIIGKLRS